MSTSAPDELIAGLGEADVLAEAVEAHLDAHPLPVDEEEVARIAARLHRRIQAEVPPDRTGWWVGGLLLAAAAAAALLWTGSVRDGTTSTTADEGDAAVLQVDGDEALRVVTVPITHSVAGRELTVDTGTTLLTSEQGSSGVVLVQEGRAALDAVEVPAEHWAIVTNSDAEVIVFPDGQAPPVPVPDAVEAQLDDLRWRSLPPRTLDALDELLSDGEEGDDR